MRAIAITHLFLLAGSAFADLDLTPRTIETQFGAYATSRIAFLDGEDKYSIRLDSDAEVSAAEGGTLFRFRNIPQAVAHLRPSPIKADTPFDPDGLILYKKAAVSLLPSTAEEVTLEGQGPDALSFPDGPTYGFSFAYSIAQSRMRMNVIFVNFRNQQFIIQHSAQQKDHDAVTERVARMFQRWHRVLPEQTFTEN